LIRNYWGRLVITDLAITFSRYGIMLGIKWGVNSKEVEDTYFTFGDKDFGKAI